MKTAAKKQIHHLWTKLRAVKPVHLAAVFLVLLTITTLSLRQNNQTMAELRQAVYTADEQNGDVEGALRKLRQHVYAHMNTDLSVGSSVYPPIQLKHTYERLVAAEQENARKANAAVYTEAQAHCERLYPQSFSGGPRIPCISEYVASHGVPVPAVPDSLYKFDFTSPSWSPDLAGWSLVLTTISFVLLMLRLAIHYVLKRLHI